MAHLGVEICQKPGLCEQSQTLDKMTFHPSKQKPNLGVYHFRNVRKNTARPAVRGVRWTCGSACVSWRLKMHFCSVSFKSDTQMSSLRSR